jgi:hypothetical protein
MSLAAGFSTKTWLYKTLLSPALLVATRCILRLGLRICSRNKVSF